jgi:hypothetical protein
LHCLPDRRREGGQAHLFKPMQTAGVQVATLERNASDFL